jgi:proteic killer suppression protein
LRRLFEEDDARGVRGDQRERLATILSLLDVACRPEDLGLPALRLHPLSGDLRGLWSVTVSANWRVTFRFDGENVRDVDLIDYH